MFVFGGHEGGIFQTFYQHEVDNGRNSNTAEQEEKRAEREDRRKHYYGSDGNTPQYKRHPHIFLFRPEDLDNEDVIMQVEDTPTYKRTRQMLEDIRHIASGQQETTKKEEGDEPVKGVISFA